MTEITETLQEYEELFSHRFSSDDPEFQEYVKRPADAPPLVEDWRGRAGGNQRGRDRYQDRRGGGGRGWGGGGGGRGWGGDRDRGWRGDRDRDRDQHHDRDRDRDRYRGHGSGYQSGYNSHYQRPHYDRY